MTFEIETTVKNGLPCIARVIHYYRQKPLGREADSDWDCNGYEDIEFELVTLKGKPAPWLNALLSEKDQERINGEISEQINSRD